MDLSPIEIAYLSTYVLMSGMFPPCGSFHPQGTAEVFGRWIDPSIIAKHDQIFSPGKCLAMFCLPGFLVLWALCHVLDGNLP